MTSKTSTDGGQEQPQQAADPAAPGPRPSGGAQVTRQDLPISPRTPGSPDSPPPPSGSPAQPGAPSAAGTGDGAPPEPAAAAPAAPPAGSPAATPAESPAAAPPAAQAPQLLPAQRPAPPPEQAAPGTVPAPSQFWHRHHFPVGAFLIAYGVAGLLGTAIDWHGRRHEIAGYLADTAGLGAGAATPVLAGIKFAEILLTLIVVAGVARRRDVWFLPALVGWMAGFAVFCVLDLWAGKPGRLAEHGLYIAGFAVLLFISYALGVKVRVGRPRAATPAGGKSSGPTNLSRTQEIALAALNRWQRGTS